MDVKLSNSIYIIQLIFIIYYFLLRQYQLIKFSSKRFFELYDVSTKQDQSYILKLVELIQDQLKLDEFIQEKHYFHDSLKTRNHTRAFLFFASFYLTVICHAVYSKRNLMRKEKILDRNITPKINITSKNSHTI